MPPHKSHHFVPQFYLRNFGEENSIAMFNIARRQHIPTASIPGQCQRSYLYGRDPSVEAALAQMEGLASIAIRNLIVTETVPADDSVAFFSLVAFLAFQHGRTPQAGAVMNEIATKLSRAILKMPGMVPAELHADIPKLRASWGKAALQSLGIAASVSHVLLDLRPFLLINDTPQPFITSDSPVVFFNPWCRGWRGSGVTAFASSGLQIFLPLSPRHLLMLVDDDVYAFADASGVIHVDRYRDVKGLNALQLLGVEHNLYYRRTPTAQEAIDDLPLHWMHDSIAAVHVQRAVAADERSQLVGLHQEQPDVRLDLSFFRVRRAKRAVPLPVRARSHRQRALDADRFFRGRSRKDLPADIASRLFHVVEVD